MCDELPDVTGTFGHDDPIFPEMATQGVDRLCPLPYQKIPSSEDNGIGLGCFALHRNKAHRRSLRRLADRLGVGGIVLLSLHKRLHVSRRDQADPMAKLADRTRPVVRAAARFHRHNACWLTSKKRKHLLAPQPLPEYHLAGCICSVCLKYPLRYVQTDRANFRHGRLLFSGGQHPPLWHTKAVGGGVHPITTRVESCRPAVQKLNAWTAGGSLGRGNITKSPEYPYNVAFEVFSAKSAAMHQHPRASTFDNGRASLYGWQDRVRDPSLTVLLGLAAAAASGLYPGERLFSTFALGGQWSSATASVLGHGGFILAFSALTWVVAHALYAPGRITFHRLQGAMVVYLSLATIFANAFGLVWQLIPGAFANLLPAAPGTSEFATMFYFSLATLTTTGYGDIVPLNPFARSLAGLESVVGPFYLAITLARLVTLWLRMP